MLAGLCGRVPGLLAGGQANAIAFIDVDDTIREVHGYAKQGAAYGYSGVRGLNVQLATILTPLGAPVMREPGSARATPPRPRGREVARSGHHDRPCRGCDRADPGAGGLGLLRVGIRGHRDSAQGVVLGDPPG